MTIFKKLFIFLLFVGLRIAYSQDTIQKKDNKILIVNILSIEKDYVYFQEINSNDTTKYSFDLKLISAIQYKNGKKISFELPNLASTAQNKDTTILEIDPQHMFIKGESDGYYYYYNHRSVLTGNYIAGLLGPLTILVPVLTSLVPPENEDLGCPNLELLKDKNYRKGYLKSVMRQKRVSAWGGYGLGNVTIVALVGLIVLKIELQKSAN